MSIDVSTHQLAEQTCQALGGKISLEDVLTVWHNIGKATHASHLKDQGITV
jgi:membrane-associated HD superfamily phosphohydrolase